MVAIMTERGLENAIEYNGLLYVKTWIMETRDHETYAVFNGNVSPRYHNFSDQHSGQYLRRFHPHHDVYRVYDKTGKRLLHPVTLSPFCS